MVPCPRSGNVPGPHPIEGHPRMTTQSPPSNPIPLLSPLTIRGMGPWLLSVSLAANGCVSQDWAMGLGSSDTSNDQSTNEATNPTPKDADAKSLDDSTDSATGAPSTGAPSSDAVEEPTGQGDDVQPGDTQEEGPDSDIPETSGPDTLPDEPGPDAESSTQEPDTESLPEEQDPETFPEEPEPEPEPEPHCGDGIIQSNEECDDGNTSDNDACLSNCKQARCGDYVVWEGKEECDPGPYGDATQMSSCAEVCGQFSEPILEARPPTRTCYGSGARACRGGPWDCRGCRDPNQ